MRFGLLFVLFASTFLICAQNKTVVTGKVIESETGTPIPFANVVFLGTTDGAITDFDGNFRAETDQKVDSIEARYIGYLTRTKIVTSGTTQNLNFQLDENIETLNEVVIYAGENPAFPILRQVIDNRDQNDKRSLTAYEYEAYTKIEIDVDNISGKLKERKPVQKISSVLDSIQQIAGDDGKPILPVFFSEALSNYYYRTNPVHRHEHILKTRITGVGLTDGTTTSQIIGSTFQEYNFYRNWLNILDKDFASPIGAGWMIHYDYDLIDSLMIEEDSVYRIDFYPKNDQDLAFTGTMWITNQDFALKRIDATISKSANLNYIEKIKIQQDLSKTSSGPWMPAKSRVVVDVGQLTESTAGLLAKFYVSTKNVVVDQPKPVSFYQNPVKLEPDAQNFEEGYWNSIRHDSLTRTEENVYLMIDTLKKIPFVKTGLDAGKFAFTGYHKTGPIDLGPYTVLYGNNDIEGRRFGVGARTNYQFSHFMTFGGYYAYGLKDNRSKYQAYVDFVLDREKWTTVRLERREEIDQIWLLGQEVPVTSFLFTFSRFGNLTQPFSYSRNKLTLQRQLLPRWSQSYQLKNESFNPLFEFSFNKESENGTDTYSNFDITEITVSTHWGKDEIFVINDNERWSLGTVKWPAITLDYSYGIPDFLGGDLDYHKLRLRIDQRQQMGAFGTSRITLEGGAIFGDVPYPLLFNLIGNETPFYASFTYNMMNFFEFSNDRFVSLRYRHYFEGLILNKVPLLRKLKLRSLATANVVYGALSDKNLNIVNYELDDDGNAVIPFYTFGRKPYIEVGYGIENILKVIRIDAFHRLTYLDHEGVNKFGVKLSFQFIL